MLARLQVHCKHAYYRWIYGMKMPWHQVLAARVFKLLWARPLPSALRSRR